jgi:hypothetical protein
VDVTSEIEDKVCLRSDRVSDNCGILILIVCRLFGVISEMNKSTPLGRDNMFQCEHWNKIVSGVMEAVYKLKGTERFSQTLIHYWKKLWMDIDQLGPRMIVGTL